MKQARKQKKAKTYKNNLNFELKKKKRNFELNKNIRINIRI